MKKLILLLVILLVNVTNSQEIEFGDVTKDELTETICSIDSSANAAVLYKYRNTYFTINGSGAEMVTEVHEKIKIYNQDGFDHATHEILLFKSRSTRENIGKIKAITYNLDGEKIVETDLEKDQIFKSEFNENYNQIKFTMPNLNEGSVIEYKYKITSPFFYNVDEFVFQHDIPIKKIEAKLKRPKGFVFKPKYKGYLTFYPKIEQYTNARISQPMVNETYILNNVPALKEEPYVDNIDNYRAGVSYELSSIEIGTYRKYYAQTWGDVAKSIGNSDDYKKELDKAKAFSEEIDMLLDGVTQQNKKMEKIFEYVKDNFTWNEYDGKYFQNGIKNTLKEKKGNAADINLLLVAMLRYAGIESNPVVISTKDNSIPFFPTLDGLNFVIAYAVINEKAYYMDATREFSDINMLPIRDYNWEGILINNLKKVWKKISLSKPNQAIAQYQLKGELSDDGVLEGSYTSKLKGYYAYNFRNKIKDEELEEFIATRESDFNDIEISEYTTDNVDSYKGNVTEKFNFYYENGAEVLNDKIYIQPLTFLKMEENPFKDDKRTYPIDFGYPFKDLYIINIQIPEGYEIESIGSPMIIRTPNKNAEFKYQASSMNNKISISVSLNVKKAMHAADTYLYLKEFFSQIINKETEQIVLKKATP